MSRTKKQPYTKSKRFDMSCRCHGGCPYCLGNRLIRTKKEGLRVNLKAEIEHQIDSSSDAMEFFYPEKQAYLDKHYHVDE